jgi:threonine aldolase
MRSFASDNNSGVHSDIIDAITSANTQHTIAYGDDVYTHEAEQVFKNLFKADVDVYFTFLGTGANVLAMKSSAQSFNSVLCADTAHINVDECGAVQNFTGASLNCLPSVNGKISVSDIEKELHSIGDEHHSQPSVVSISQPTELGTLYSVDEIKEICDFAHANNLVVHVDGARIANAVAAMNVSVNEMITDTGVDLLSFGGTKNGMMYGEALVVLNKRLSANIKYFRKQAMQLSSKMRFISAQFTALLNNNLYIRLAKHSNDMTKLLQSKLNEISQIKITRPIETNAIFAKVPVSLIEPLREKYFFYTWNEEENEVRWMTSFDTTEEDVESFVSCIKDVIG